MLRVLASGLDATQPAWSSIAASCPVSAAHSSSAAQAAHATQALADLSKMRAFAAFLVTLSLLGAAQAQTSGSAIFPELLGALTGGSNGTSSQAYLYSVASELASGFEGSLEVRAAQLAGREQETGCRRQPADRGQAADRQGLQLSWPAGNRGQRAGCKQGPGSRQLAGSRQRPALAVSAALKI